MSDATAAKLKSLFQKYDANGDGVLSMEELSGILQKLGSKPQDIKVAFGQMDANHDGSVQYDELVDWLTGAKKQSGAAQANNVSDVFMSFSGGKTDMDGKTLAKLCKDCSLLCKRFTATDVDLVFAKVVTKGQRRIDVQQFQKAIQLIAEKKGSSVDSITAQILAAGGPTLKGTVADSVRFHDDKNTYTGTHVNGGPEHVAVGAGTAADQSWKRPDNAPVQTTPRDHHTMRPAQVVDSSTSAQAAPTKSSAKKPSGTMTEAFKAHCSGEMDGKTFAKFCKDAGLVDKKLTPTDVDLIFAKVVQKGQRRIDYHEFEKAFELIAEKKGVDHRVVADQVMDCSGPVLHGTQADAVRFHDDKNTYTGTHVNGGPESVPVGGGTVADTSWKRPDAQQQSPQPPAAPKPSSQAPHRPGSRKDPEPTRPAKGANGNCSNVKETFLEYCDGEMDGKTFAKLCRDTSLLDKKFTATDVDLIFAKAVSKGQRRIDYNKFEVALQLIADKKGMTIDDIHDSVLSVRGPVLAGTVADNVRFHDDKSTYTGVHVNGGPESVAVGQGTVADSSWKRPG